MMSALAIVTNLSPAISFAVAIPCSTLPVNVVRGNRSAASAGGGRWVTTTTGAPAGWLSPQPSVRSNSRRPATSAPQPRVSSCSIGALAASTEKLMVSCALGTSTSPFQYQSNNSAGLSSGWATKPSSDMHMWVSTLVMAGPLPRLASTDSRGAADECEELGLDIGVVDRRTGRQRDPGAVEERREPLDEVADDVACDPPLHRGGALPRVGRHALDRRGERAGDAAVLVGRTVHRSSATSASSLA